MSYLYIFVDESGNPSRGECYVVAGCWCVCDTSNPSRALQSTVDTLKTRANSRLRNSSPVSELKGTQLPSDVLIDLVRGMNDPAYSDGTVLHGDTPWSEGQPLQFSADNTNPDLANELLQELHSGSQLDATSARPTAIKSLSLLSVLNPVCQDGALDLAIVDRVKVILDDNVWSVPSNHVETALGQVDVGPESISFDTRDSVRTPGLQLADLAAYSYRRDRMEGDCPQAVREIEDRRLASG